MFQRLIRHMYNQSGGLFAFPQPYRITGTPNEAVWPGVTSLPDFQTSFPKWPPKDLKLSVPNLSSAGLDLLKRMLYLDPSRRVTATSALEHEYFKDMEFVR